MASEYDFVVKAGEIANRVIEKLRQQSLPIPERYTSNNLTDKRDKGVIPEFLYIHTSSYKYAIEAADWIVFAHRLANDNGNATNKVVGDIFKVASRTWGENEATRERLESIYEGTGDNYKQFILALIEETLDLNDAVRQSAGLPPRKAS